MPTNPQPARKHSEPSNEVDITLNPWPPLGDLPQEHRAAVEEFHRKIESGEIETELIEAFRSVK